MMFADHLAELLSDAPARPQNAPIASSGEKNASTVTDRYAIGSRQS
jgi:hypothetical protein